VRIAGRPAGTLLSAAAMCLTQPAGLRQRTRAGGVLACKTVDG